MPAAKKAKVATVSAPLVQVRLGDRVVHFYQGDILPEGVSQESLDHLLDLGYVTGSDAPAETDDK